MEVIRIRNEEPFAATKIDWWPRWWAVLPHYLSNLFISLWNDFRGQKFLKTRILEISVAGSNFEIVAVNCIIIWIFPQNSEESSSQNQFKLDLMLDLSPLLSNGDDATKSRNDFCHRETSLCGKRRKLSMSPFRKRVSCTTPFHQDRFKRIPFSPLFHTGWTDQNCFNTISWSKVVWLSRILPRNFKTFFFS